MHGPYFSTTAAAARYCGMSRQTFESLLRDYYIPKEAGLRGQERWAASTLDEFMAEPEKFRRVERKQRSVSGAEAMEVVGL